MKIFRTLAITSAISLCAFGALSAHAQAPATPAPAALMTEKKVFSLPSYTTFGGKVIKNVKVGYETYGTLNATGDPSSSSASPISAIIRPASPSAISPCAMR